MVKLDEVVPWGRSFDEYMGMFDLSAADLAGSILDCGAGPASFAAEADARGHRVTACDPLYGVAADEIRRRVDTVAPLLLADMVEDHAGYRWDEFESPELVGEMRLAAMGRFLADFDAGRAAGRYVKAALPCLPFADDSFDLAVVSHVLFLYSDQLDTAFHLAAIEELARVATEVRVFPLIDLAGGRSVHVEPVTEALRRLGRLVEIVRVPYEFRRGADAMLRVSAGREA